MLGELLSRNTENPSGLEWTFPVMLPEEPEDETVHVVWGSCPDVVVVVVMELDVPAPWAAEPKRLGESGDGWGADTPKPDLEEPGKVEEFPSG